MPRPTREFTTSGGHTLILNEYITGAENWQIRNIYTRGFRKDADDSNTGFDAERKALELVIVSMDGNVENIADRVLALPLSEYKEVTAEVTPIVEGKKKSEAS